MLDQNWFDLSNMLRLPREGRTWVKELQTVRNKWAHLSSETMPPSEVYRDADTLGRLFTLIGADQTTLQTVEAVKADALVAMAPSTSRTDDMAESNKGGRLVRGIVVDVKAGIAGG